MGSHRRPHLYAVAEGRTRGIFRTWEECEASVKGYPGSKFKGFDGLAGAEAFLAVNPPPPPQPPRVVQPLQRPGTLFVQTLAAQTPAVQTPVVAPNRAAIDIFVDGACPGNGRDGALGGFGGFYGDGDPRNFSMPLEAGERQTNNRGELRAIEYAIRQELETATRSGRFDALRIHTDSMYSINCLTTWLPNWKRNGFMTGNKQPVENKDLIVSIDRLVSDYSRCKTVANGGTSEPAGVQLFHVKGHSHVYGNEMADRLAVEGAAKPRGRPRPPDDEAEPATQAMPVRRPRLER